MTEYLVNVGEFNIIVLPNRKQYFLLPGDEQSAEIQQRFLSGEPIAYGTMEPLWFQYSPEESWTDFDGKSYRLGRDLAEKDLVDMYVLKKFNFGSLVAVRDSNGGKARLFKRDMLNRRLDYHGSI